MDYNAPTGSTDLNAPYVGKNVSAGIQGSKVPPHAVEYPQREIVNALLDAGMTPSNGDLTQLAQAIRKGSVPYGVAGGTANAITVTLDSAPATPAWTKLRLFLVRITAANTGAATIAPNGLTARAFRLNDGTTAFGGGELAVGGVALCLNDGTNVQLLAMLPATVAQAIADTQLWHVAPLAAAGTANALTATCVPAITAYTHMANYLVVPNVTNTGSATIAFNGLAAVLIVNRDGSLVSAGQIMPNVPMWLVYFSSGTPYFVLMNPAAEASRAKFWVEFDGTTTPPTVRKAFNVASVARLAQGTYKVTFTNPMPAADYAVSGIASNNSGYGCYVNLANVSYGGYTAGASPRTVNDVIFFTSAYSTGPLDNSFVSLIGFAAP